jgi:hypothetical protein
VEWAWQARTTPWAVKAKRPNRWGDGPAHHTRWPKSRRRNRTRRQDKNGRGDSASPDVEEVAEVPSARPRSLCLGQRGRDNRRGSDLPEVEGGPHHVSRAAVPSAVRFIKCGSTLLYSPRYKIRNMGADRRTPLYPPRHVSRHNGDRIGRKAHYARPREWLR